MQARPRYAENGVAKALSVWFASHGLSPIERKPVIGRTGPDFTMNELGLVIDAKSRIKVPKAVVIPDPVIIQIGPSFLGVRIKDLDLLLTDGKPVLVVGSLMVTQWWRHMDEWRQIHTPNGITVVVLHKPVETKDGKRTARQSFADATFVINMKDREVIRERITEWKNRTSTVHSGVGEPSAQGGPYQLGS